MKKEKVTYTDKRIVTDPSGSYTGQPQNPTEMPIQDADDL